MPEGPIFIFPESIEDKKAEPEAARFYLVIFYFLRATLLKRFHMIPIYIFMEKKALLQSELLLMGMIYFTFTDLGFGIIIQEQKAQDIGMMLPNGKN